MTSISTAHHPGDIVAQLWIDRTGYLIQAIIITGTAECFTSATSDEEHHPY